MSSEIETIEPFHLTSTGFPNVFVAKLELTGDFLAAYRIAGDRFTNLPGGLALTPEDELLIAGSFDGTAEFDQDWQRGTIPGFLIFDFLQNQGQFLFRIIDERGQGTPFLVGKLFMEQFIDAAAQ